MLLYLHDAQGSRCATLTSELILPSCTTRHDADGCYQLQFPARRLLPKPVHGWVQDEQQCELCFRVERCGRPALPCAPCYARMRIRSHAAADSGSNGVAQLMCDLFRLRGAVIATEVHWHCGDARQAHVLIGTHALHATRRRSIPSGLTVARQESPRIVIGRLPRRRLLARVDGSPSWRNRTSRLFSRFCHAGRLQAITERLLSTREQLRLGEFAGIDFG